MTQHADIVTVRFRNGHSYTAVREDGDAGTDLIEQLQRLAELRDAGVVTDEEFEAKKAELLQRL